MSIKTPFKIILEAIKEFDRDDVTVHGAALSFYMALSLAPMLVILMFVAGIIGAGAQQRLIVEIVDLVGLQAAVVIQMIMENAQLRRDAGSISALLGIGALIVSGGAVFSQLQSSMNLIWNVEAIPGRGAFHTWLRKRALSLSLMAGIGFLMLVSLAVSGALSLVFSGEGTRWEILDVFASLLIYTLLFAMVFKVLPDVKVAWRDVWIGALITAILFDVGKYALGKYLGYSGFGSAYGAAGSLVVLLVWVYYSSLIMFFGAELAQVISRGHGSPPPPEEFAKAGNPKKAPPDPEVTIPVPGAVAPFKGEENS